MEQADRRRSERKRGFFAIQLDSLERANRIGVSRDVSMSGMLIASPSRFAVGEEVRVHIYFPNDARESVRARVARVEETPLRSDEPWRYRLALEFDSEYPQLLSLTSLHGPTALSH